MKIQFTTIVSGSIIAGSLIAFPAYAQVNRPAENLSGPYCDESGEECALVGGVRQIADDRITVLANGLWSRLEQTGQAVSVIDNATLRAVQGPDLTRALQQLPGVSLTRNGGLGSFTGLSVRGAGSDQLLVLVDGVRVNDVAGPSGGFDFGSVTMGTVDRVELLRGSNSVIWGSDALGGVIHLATRVEDGVSASAEYGGDEQFAGTLALGTQNFDSEAGVSASYVTREGFSSAATGDEADGFEQVTLAARGHMPLGHGLNIHANARFANSKADIDGFPPPDYIFADTAERQDTRQISASTGLEYAGDSSDISLSLGHAETRRDLVDEDIGPQSYYSTDGRSTRAQLRSRFKLTDSFDLLTGGDWEWTGFDDGSSAATSDTGSAHALVAFSPRQSRAARAIHLTAGLRYDRHNRFGGAWNLGANGTAELTPALRLRASYGEGFKAPSLYQLYSSYGNQSLDAERSRSIDTGLEYSAPGGAASASVTVFSRTSRNLIDFVSCFGESGGICAQRPYGTYDNIGRARSQGVEVEGGLMLTQGLEMRANYAFMDSTNRVTGNDLARRPHHTGSVSVNWQPVSQTLFLGMDLRAVSSSFDNAASTLRLAGHALLDLRARWAVSDKFELFGRAENVWDEKYQTAAGYASQGRAAFIGVTARL